MCEKKIIHEHARSHKNNDVFLFGVSNVGNRYQETIDKKKKKQLKKKYLKARMK